MTVYEEGRMIILKACTEGILPISTVCVTAYSWGKAWSQLQRVNTYIGKKNPILCFNTYHSFPHMGVAQANFKVRKYLIKFTISELHNTMSRSKVHNSI